MPLIYFKKRAIAELIAEILGYDPYWDNVVLLMHMENLIDEKGHVITQTGTSAISTVPKFGNSSWSNVGAVGYLQSAGSTDFTLPGAFTVEYWVKFNASTTYPSMIGVGQYNDGFVMRNNPGGYGVYVNQIPIGSLSIPYDSQWHHIAMTRDASNVVNCFVDGVAVITTTAYGTLNVAAGGVTIGASAHSVSEKMDGWIDEVRITKGIARYTANFTVPTSAFLSFSSLNWEPVWGKTVLLLKGDGRIDTTWLDTSSNNWSVTKYNAAVITDATTPMSGSYSYKFDSTTGITLGSGAGTIETDQFCIELWAKPNAFTSAGSYGNLGTTLIHNYLWQTGNNAGYALFINSAGLLTLRVSNGVYNVQNDVFTSSSALTLSVWNHIAITRDSSNTLRCFINGVAAGSMTFASSLNMKVSGVTTWPFKLGYTISDGTYYQGFNGYMSNIRIVKGQPVYTTAFTPSTTPLTAITGTNLLLSATISGYGNSNFVDSSANNLSITRTGNATQGAYSPFTIPDGYWSTYFDGAGDYLTSTGPSMSGSWTVEAWIYPTLASTYQYIVSFNNGAVAGVGIGLDNANHLMVDDGSTPSTPFSGATVNINAWNHIAFVRNGTTTTGFINGVAVGSNTFTPSGTTSAMFVGRINNATGYYFRGNISNLRVTNTAVYTGNFVPASIPLTAISGTSALVCQSSRLVDASSNNRAITAFGDTKVSVDTPFDNPSEISTQFGSGYFDGAADYLSVPNSTAFDFASDNFTFEFWVNTNSLSVLQTIMMKRNNGGYAPFMIYLNTAGQISLYLSATGGAWDLGGTVVAGAVTPLKAGCWNHVAIVRNGTNILGFINGKLDTTTAYNKAVWSNTSPVIVGMDLGNNAYGMNGYLSNVRISKGVARYTGDFTPSTVISDANTSLLLNFNNAQIVDSTGRHDLETVGTAQTTTAMVGSGTGAIYFNGTTDYLNINKVSTPLNTSDFTIEGWIYTTSMASYQTIFACRDSAVTATGFNLVINKTNGGMYMVNNVAVFNTAGGFITTNKWYHVALVRASGVVRAYVNGVLIATATDTSNYSNSTWSVGTLVNGGEFFNGYMDDFRITKGFARYSTNFVPQRTTIPAKQLTDAAYDPYWNNVVLSMNMDSLIDAKGHTVSNSSTSISTAIKKYGAGSLTFNGSSHLTIPSSGVFDFGTSDFTIEFWFNSSTAQSGSVIFDPRNAAGDGQWMLMFGNGAGAGNLNCLTWRTANASSWISSSTSIVDGSWHHCAITRKSGVIHIFVDGTRSAVGNDSTNYTYATTTFMGRNSYAAQQFVTGNVDDLRITRDVARYENDFAVPVQANLTQ